VEANQQTESEQTPANMTYTNDNVDKKIQSIRERIKGNLYANKYWATFLNLPKRYIGKFITQLNDCPDQVSKAVECFNSAKSLFIHGSPGTGKTHLAVGLMYEWIPNGVNLVADPYGAFDDDGLPKIVVKNEFDNFSMFRIPKFLPSTEFFLEIKETYDKKNQTESEVISNYSFYDILVIDDLGAEKISEWSRQLFYILLDRRYRDMKQTIITSNLSLKEVSERLDDRIASRIAEMGEIIKMDGKDYRINKK
jgi:DNA replication protein DnaC